MVICGFKTINMDSATCEYEDVKNPLTNLRFAEFCKRGIVEGKF